MSVQKSTYCARAVSVTGRSKPASKSCVAIGKSSSNRFSPGYLFIQLAVDANWAPLRSTRGVSRIVAFGSMPLRLDNGLIMYLQQRTVVPVKPALEAGDSVRIAEGGFAELDAIFVAMDGEQRVILLLNMLNRQQQISMPLLSVIKN